ncbi:hypothetical protein WOLCODRAFT_139552 [Wolfiporia cocos MD-104 SS10]|uniref:Uncharacterized protein n=1 Tax=Wolfiporia cocos (strain MD-104) TaxID=742152 RepID=A0A2H3IXL7_WOLCO|nr:hypothetical protein WOLCODRAFT_139552 [Wolfiporia cocos MD-104 SS10]
MRMERRRKVLLSQSGGGERTGTISQKTDIGRNATTSDKSNRSDLARYWPRQVRGSAAFERKPSDKPGLASHQRKLLLSPQGQ